MIWDYDQLLETIKNKGYRITGIRSMILKVLWDNKHLTFQDLVAKLQKEEGTVNLTSVYNNINFFLDNGLIYTNTFDGKQIVYELSYEKLVHLVCDSCKNVIHLDNDENSKEYEIDYKYIDKLKERLESKNFKAVHYKIEAHGICENCQKLNRLNEF